MPAKSEKQARLMRAAAHGATFKKAKDIRASMTPQQIKDFEHTKRQRAADRKNFQSEGYSYNNRDRRRRGNR